MCQTGKKDDQFIKAYTDSKKQGTCYVKLFFIEEIWPTKQLLAYFSVTRFEEQKQ